MFSFTPYIVSVCFPFSLGEGFLQNVQGSLETAHIKDTKCWAKPLAGWSSVPRQSPNTEGRRAASRHFYWEGWTTALPEGYSRGSVSPNRASNVLPENLAVDAQETRGAGQCPPHVTPSSVVSHPLLLLFHLPKACKKSPISYKDFTLILFILMGFFFFFTFFFLISRGKQINMI